MAGVIVLDASVLIAHLDADDAHHELATRLLLDTVDEPLGASPLTLAEVLVGPARAGRAELVEGALRELGVGVVPLDDDAPRNLAELRVRTQLRLPDCFVLLAARTAVGYVATFDDRLHRAAAELGLVHPV
jgi:predicted nucleic acid-binding protein